MNVSSAVQILLVDDHPVVRRGVRDILAEAYPCASIREVGTGGEALGLITAGEPCDIVILDLTLPDGSGLDVLKRIRAARPRLPVLVLSMHGADQVARRVITAGAAGFLTKDAADAELVTAATELLRGGRYFSREALERAALGIHPDRAERLHERLSDREYQILRMIGSGKAVSEIAEALSLSVKTVSTYRARLLEKMGMHTNAELTRYVIEQRLLE